MKNLLNNESIIYKTKIHAYYKGFYISLLIAFSVFSIWLVNIELLWSLVKIISVHLIIVLCIIAYKLIEIFCVRIYITNKRFIHKKWLLWQNTLDIELNRIDSIQINKWLIGWFMNTGHVTISWSGWQIRKIVYVVNPVELKNTVYKQRQ